jgi:hypothetical protein
MRLSNRGQTGSASGNVAEIPLVKAILDHKLGEIMVTIPEGVMIRFADGSRRSVTWMYPGLLVNPTEAQIRALAPQSSRRAA